MQLFRCCLLSLLLVACGGGREFDSLPTRDEPLGLSSGGKPRVVVAVLDNGGVNAYHQFFYAGGPNYPEGRPPQAVDASLLDEFGITERCQISLTRSGDFETDFAADVESGLWRTAEGCDMVWFVGTNLLVKSTVPGRLPYLPDDNGDTHGFGVTAAALNANPEAVLLHIEGTDNVSESFVFNHPAVDIVSNSYGWPASIPLPGHLQDSFSGVWGDGKLHFGACDNSPAVGFTDTTCGPWWTIGIAGFQEALANEPGPSSGGRQSLSGNFPDFLADFTQTLPYCQDCEDGYTDRRGGTSFATPRAAGVASAVLLSARRQLGHQGGVIRLAEGDTLMAAGDGQSFNNWQLRRALEQAAWVPAFGDYDLALGLDEYGPGLPILPVAPWLQMGWGVLTTTPEAGVVERALVLLGLREGEQGQKEPGFCEFQTAAIQVRKAYWDTLNIRSQTFLAAPDPDPFVAC